MFNSKVKEKEEKYSELCIEYNKQNEEMMSSIYALFKSRMEAAHNINEVNGFIQNYNVTSNVVVDEVEEAIKNRNCFFEKIHSFKFDNEKSIEENEKFIAIATIFGEKNTKQAIHDLLETSSENISFKISNSVVASTAGIAGSKILLGLSNPVVFALGGTIIGKKIVEKNKTEKENIEREINNINKMIDSLKSKTRIIKTILKLTQENNTNINVNLKILNKYSKNNCQTVSKKELIEEMSYNTLSISRLLIKEID